MSSNYWNMVYGRLPGEAKEDVECLSTMRQLARNMTFLIRALQDAKEKYVFPEEEAHVMTNFIRYNHKQ